ncbi:MAG: helix-turn-helix transcriptional regulator [Clostridia bacterium]|nr:helix-turn-helix transcriptional regulator [Clostridia bacterium]
MLHSYVEIKKDASLSVMPVTIGLNFKQGVLDRPSGFEVNQFLWVNKGECLVETPEGSQILKEGQCFFSRRLKPHKYKGVNGDLYTGWVSFRGGENLLDAFKIGNYLVFDCPSFLQQSARQLWEICCSAGNAALRSAHTNLWMTELLCAIQNSNQTLAEQVCNVLERDFSKNLTLEKIAEKVHYNKYSLCHAYTRETGESIMQTLKKIRIRKARHMLRYSEYAIEDVGKYCGFESSSYFIKIFKEETGKTPGQYRKKE